MPVTNCPETPRQKMIGMMYLVLTAMLALNVSNEVLDAFALVNNGLTKTNENFEGKNYNLYTDFENKYNVNKEKVGTFWKNAQQVRSKANELFAIIEKYKIQIAKNADGSDFDMNNIRRKDDREAASFMLKKGNAKNLKKDFNEFKVFLLNMIPATDTSHQAKLAREAIEGDINTGPIIAKDGAKIPWESANFENNPAISAITMMTKMQNDIRNAESDAISYLYGQIEAKSYKFTSVKGRVIGSDYMLKGSNYTLDIFVAAMDTTQESVVRMNSGQEFMTKGGVFTYSFSPLTIGSKKLEGVILYKDPNGMSIPVPFSHEYQVTMPSAVVSPTKMNVFYAGIQNPVDVSSPGVPANELKKSIVNGRFVGTGKTLAVIPTAAPGNKCTISLSNKYGKVLGAKEFRIRRIPDPVAMVGSKKGGRISKNALLAQTGVDAVLENFNFDLKFTVKSFTVSTSIGGFVAEETSRGDVFTNKQKNLIKKLKRGQKVYIEDVIAVGPDGTSRRLPAISLKII